MNSTNLYYGQKGFISTADRLEAKGIEKGIEKTLIRNIQSLKKKMPHLTKAEIAEILEVDIAFVITHLDASKS